jgi:ABC-2 type transport system ATP-binding protein
LTEYKLETINLTKVFRSEKENEDSGFLGRIRRRKGDREEKVAVDHVNIKVRDGELFGLLGPNGAGKTTLIKMLCTLIYPTEGTALVNGYDIRKDEFKVRESVATVLGPERGFWWRLSGRQNLEFLAAVYGVPRSIASERIGRLLRLLDMEKDADRAFQKYSMGQKRKLTLAKALLPDARVLLLDEPTIGLDPTISRDIRKFVREKVIGEDGKTVLLTTHYMEEADQICDRLAIVHQGKVAAVGTPSEIKDTVKGNIVVELRVTGCPPNICEVLDGIEGVMQSACATQEDDGIQVIRVDILAMERTLQQVIESVLRTGGSIHSMKTESPSLEDAFVKLTRTRSAEHAQDRAARVEPEGDRR